MPWEWSHTQEAYEHARQEIHRLTRKQLQVIFAEWEAREPDSAGIDFDEAIYKAALEHADTLSVDVLAEAIYERASEQALCEVGGFRAWVCPWGCHTVSFGGESD